jgi:hypothetical protein
MGSPSSRESDASFKANAPDVAAKAAKRVNPGGQIHWDVYVTNDGKKGHMIRMDEGNMAVRSFEK